MTRRTLIQLGLSVLLLIGVLGMYTFWYLSVEKASAEARSLSEQILLKTKDTVRVANAKTALQSLSADEASMRSYLVREDEIVPFLGSLERAGTSLGSVVEVVSVTSDTSGPRERITLSLKIAGSFDTVVRTLGIIEYGPYDSEVSNVTLNTVPDADGWTAAVTLTFGMQSVTP